MEGVRVLTEAIMEMEVEEHIGAARHERAEGRSGQRNGYRQRAWDTRTQWSSRCPSRGALEATPKEREGLFLAWIEDATEPRRVF
jgi:transposase-like protein